MSRVSTTIFIRLIIISVIAILSYVVLSDYIALETIKQHRISLRHFVQKHYAYSVILYLISYAALVMVLFPSSSIITLMGGYLFGVVEGAVYSVLAATIGASLLFFIIRHLFSIPMQKRYADKIQHFKSAIKKGGISFLLFVRLTALFPFFIVNIVLALVDIPFTTFFWTTAIGIIPGTTVYAFSGRQLAMIKSMSDIFSPGVMLAFIALASCALIPLAVQYLCVSKRRS